MKTISSITLKHIIRISRKKRIAISKLAAAARQQEKGDFAAAICAYRETINGLKNDKNPEETAIRAFCLENLSRCCFRMKQYYEAGGAAEEAMETYKKAGKINPRAINKKIKELTAPSKEIMKESDEMF